MKLTVYSVKDIKAGVYQYWFLRRSDVEALRFVEGGVNEKDTMLNKNPEDYEVYSHCVVDDETGEVVSKSKVFVCNVMSLKKEVVKNESRVNS